MIDSLPNVGLTGMMPRMREGMGDRMGLGQRPSPTFQRPSINTGAKGPNFFGRLKQKAPDLLSAFSNRMKQNSMEVPAPRPMPQGRPMFDRAMRAFGR